MNPDQVAEISRHLLMEAMLLSAPVLIASCLVSVVLSVLQTLTSIQDQTLTAVPRLLVVFVAGTMTMPWFLRRLVLYTVHLWADFHRYLG